MSSFDDALKEAIRRSLKDSTSKEAEILANTQPAATVEPAKVPSSEDLVSEAKKTALPETTPVEEEEMDIVVKPEAEEDINVPAAEPEVPTNVVDPDNEVEKMLEDSMDSESVDSEKMVEEMEKKPAAVERETSQTSKNAGVDDSFASDAVGIGDVAEAMGTTLDIVAGVISEMLSEADLHEKKADEESAKNDAPSTKDSAEVSEPAPTEAERSDGFNKESSKGEGGDEGALILDSVGGSDKTGESEDSDWHVVKKEEESVKADEEIARAAEMLGSALFNSDIQNSEENMSTLSSSDSFSLGTSVPSTVPSISVSTQTSHVAPPQRDMWAAELAQLRELGFHNEDLCVEVLERLNAANIGVGSEDEVSITQVVNAILEEK